MKKAIRAKADGPKPYASRWSQTVRKSMVPGRAPAAVSGYPQAKRSGWGMERSGRSEGQYCLRSHPSNIQRRGKCSKKWEGVDMQGRKRCCPEGPWPPAAVSGYPQAKRSGGMERSGRSEGQYCLRLPNYPKPTTPNQPPHQPAATIDKPPPGNHEKEDDLQVDRLIGRPAT